MLWRMAEGRRCVVKFRDAEGVEHAVQVSAGSLYEAACVGLAQFRRSGWSREEALEAGTLQVEVWEAPTVYRIKVEQLERWLERGGGSPREVALRQRIRGRLKAGG
jgi:hypothetical protein